MSAELATEYADSIAEGIRADCDAGHPFGIVSDDNPVTDRENGEDVDAFDYLSDALDIVYLADSDRTYRSARVLITFGGPTAWIDTGTGALEVAWWSEEVRRYLPGAFIGALDDACAELYESY